MNSGAAQSIPPQICFHCAAEIQPGSAIVDHSDGVERLFCCKGCRGAYFLITGAGLDDYYRRREVRVEGPGGEAYHTDYADDYLSRFVQPVGDAAAIDILIDGIRCDSCVWLNEKIIAAIPGVRAARVNYATGRARVVFDPSQTVPSVIFGRISAAGYAPRPFSLSTAETAHTAARKDLLIRFGTALFLTMQLMASSFALYAGYVQGMSPTMRAVMQWFSLVVTTPVIFYSGWPFLRGAWRSIINRAPGMDLLIAIGALSSYLYSIYALLSGGEVYFETAAMIVTLILVGRLLELSARHRAAAGVERLLACTPARSLRLRGNVTETVETTELVPGDLVLVREGERFPVDGLVLEGETEVDESPATGEAIPVAKKEGDPVIAGSINLLGTVRVRVVRPAADSFIARVARLVEEAQQRRAPIQNMAEQVSALFVPAVLILSLLTFGWLVLAGVPFDGALMRTLAVVVIACPCALGLATPTAIVAGTGAAAGAGIIFRGGDILERLSRVRQVVFDKTGTLTEGRPEVVVVRPAPGVPIELLISVCAALEAGSAHPLARGVAEYVSQFVMFQNNTDWRDGCSVPPIMETSITGTELLRERDVIRRTAAPASSVMTTPGRGVAGAVNGLESVAGTAGYLESRGIAVPEENETVTGSIIHVATDGRYLGLLALNDRMRDTAPDLVTYFMAQGIAVALLSGDRPEHVREIAGRAGIVEARGGMLPDDKAVYVAGREEAGKMVLMVGDGINDAPALSAASVGCAMAGGTDIALETSSLVLTKPDLGRISLAHRLSIRTMRVIRQNLAWAFIYNLVGIPLAMTGQLTPIYAAAAMALSSLCVVGNSLRLTRLQHRQ